MEITYGALIEKYGWADIQPTLARLYSIPSKSMAEYAEAYAKLQSVAPAETRMRIVVTENKDRGTLGAHYEAVGRNGTLVKDWLQNEQARHDLKDRLEEEQDYGLCYMGWDEIKSMTIDLSSLHDFPEKEIVAHVLVEITERWHSDEKARRVLDELQAIQHGRRTGLILRQMIGSTGFLQVWSEKPNGVYHGKYAVYWERGAMMAEEGILIDGNKEGVWTYWERNGKIRKQIRFSCDKQVEENETGPWWDGAKDREIKA